MKRHNPKLATVLLAGAALWFAPANAQDVAVTQDVGEAASKAEQPALEEIVVTAQRREQNLQKVPISVVALGASALQKAGISNGDDLGNAIPGLGIQRGTGTTIVFLRGIGNSAAPAGNEASTAVYIDGIYYAQVPPSFLDFNNVQRVEVLKGPQGTLFGRNATGGLIQVITRTPTQAPEFNASIGIENYERTVLQAYLAGGITTGIAADLAVIYNHQNRGWGRNIISGSDVNKDQNFAIRSKVALELAETTNITLAADYNESRDDKSIPNQPYRGTTMGDYPPLAPIEQGSLRGFYDSNAVPDNAQDVSSYGGSMKIEQELSFATLVSLSAYRKTHIDVSAYDVDHRPDDYFHARLDQEAEQKSQEIQLVSPKSGSLTWIIGAFYLDTKDGYRNGLLGGRQFGGAEVRFLSEQHIKSLAGYAQATLEVAPGTKLTGGLRYTRDKVRISGTADIALPGGPILAPASPPVDDSSVFKKLTWKGVIDQQLSQDILAYASISRGFKAGIYPTLPASTAAAEPEVLDAYEVGLKTELLGRRLRLNGAFFYYDLKNPQLEIVQGAANVTVNAGAARVMGFDADFEMAVTNNLSLRGGFAYLDAKYTDFLNAPLGIADPGPNGGNLSLVGVDASNTRMQRAPKFTANLSPTFDIPTDNGTWSLSGSFSYNSGFWWQPALQNRQKSVTLLNAQLAYSFADEKITVRAYGKNLTDVQYYSSAYVTGGPSGNPSTPAAPRTYGMAVDLSF